MFYVKGWSQFGHKRGKLKKWPTGWMGKSFVAKRLLARLAGLEPATRGLENQIPLIMVVTPNEQILNLD